MIKMLKKLVLFLSIIIIAISINTHYHGHDESHQYHHHVHIDSHETAGEESIIHYAQHIDFQKSMGIVVGTLLLLILFVTNTFFFLFQKIIRKSLYKPIFYHNIFVYSKPILLRSVLFHAPPL